MKRTMSFRLSDESLNILSKKASIHGLTKTAVLEAFIKEFSPSTLEEKFQQKHDREKALRTFLETKPDSKIREKAWKNGFSNGWNLFQMRKSTSLFRTSQSPITKNWLQQNDLE